MLNQFSRTQMIFGKEAMNKLHISRVAVFGIGGVGGYVAEALARSGIGTLELIDDDKVCLTNLNRQIFATHRTIGQYKVDAAKERLLEINPQMTVNIHRCFYMPDTAGQFDFTQYDYIVDAVDTVKGKLELAEQAIKAGTLIISSMGTGNKVDASALRVADIYDTKVCPLARVMRHELRKRKIERLKVVYSEEAPIKPAEETADGYQENCEWPPDIQGKCADIRDIPASTAFVPAAAGLIIAGEVVKDLTRFSSEKHYMPTL